MRKPKPDRIQLANIAHEEAKLVVRNGLAKRVVEMGFTRKTSRFFVREDARFRECVKFEFGGSGYFSDWLCIFDKDLDALTKRCYPDYPSAGFDGPMPSHAGTGSIFHWRMAERKRQAAWEACQHWWNPIDWLRPAPRHASQRTRFIIPSRR